MADSKIPASTIADTNSSTSDEFVVVVPLSNPETEAHLIALGAAIAKQRNGRVIAVNIVQIPDQTPLEVARDQFDYQSSAELLAEARRDAADLGVPIETHTVLSHRLFKQIFDAVRRYDANACVMGWGADYPGVAGRAESVVDELAHALPCDLLVFKDRGFDPSRILLPTTGGPHTDMAASIARILQAEFGSNLTLLYVADDREEGEAFLRSWAADHDLTGADLLIETGDIEAAIEEAAHEHTLILIGATEVGVLSRLVRGSLVLNVLKDVDCSVIIAERETDRGLFHKLFGRQ